MISILRQLLSYLTATLGFMLIGLLEVGIIYPLLDKYLVAKGYTSNGALLLCFILGVFMYMAVSWCAAVIKSGRKVYFFSDDYKSLAANSIQIMSLLSAIAILVAVFYLDWDKYISIDYYIN